MRPATQSSDPPQFDERLRCPACEYNVSGLPEPRCPECGSQFTWEQVRQAIDTSPRIAFERARGCRRVPGFVRTWATVMFMPWIFARQTLAPMSVTAALTFVSVCFVSTLPYGPLFADWEFNVAWLVTAVVYINVQAVLLSLLDRRAWIGWRPPIRYWLLVGCYTSAVMVTEVVLGPPPLLLSDLIDIWNGGGRGVPGMFAMQVRTLVVWSQLLLWLVGLGCCFAVRIKRPHRRWRSVAPIAVLVAIGLLFLYAAIVEYVGVRIYNLLADPF